MSGEAIRQLHMFRQFLGSKSKHHYVMYITTMWHVVDPDLGDRRERELLQHHWSSSIKSGARHARFHGDSPSAEQIMQMLLDPTQAGEKMVIQLERELSESVPLGETGAGKVTRTQLVDVKKLLKERLSYVQSSAITKEVGAAEEQKIKKLLKQVDVNIALLERRDRWWKGPFRGLKKFMSW